MFDFFRRRKKAMIATIPEAPTGNTLTEQFNRADADLRAAECRLKELREGQQQMLGDLEALTQRRLKHVLAGDHRALDVDDSEIQRAERECERQAILISEADADVQAFERKRLPLADELRRETRDREMAAARTEALDQADRFVAAFKSASHELALHAIKREQLVQRFGVTDGNQIANEANALLDELRRGLQNRGWKAPGVLAPQFYLQAWLPPDAEIPTMTPAFSGITSAPQAQLISHSRPQITA